MKFTATAGELARALGFVGGVIASKSTIPTLTHVLVRAEGARVSITGTDTERECTSGAPADVSVPGVELLPGGILRDLVGRIPKGASITVETVQEGRVSVTSGRGRFALSTLDPMAFPEAKTPEGASLQVDAPSFRAILDATVGSASTETARYYLCGVYLHVLDGALAAVALDDHRLCRRVMDLPAGAEDMPGIIIPTAGVNTIISLLDGVKGDVSIWVTEARLWLRAPEADFSTALVNGEYPNYRRAIPQFNGPASTFSGAEFRAAIERAAAIMPDAAMIGAGIASTQSGIVIKVGAIGAEAAIEHVDAECHTETGETPANARYLAAMTKTWGDAPIDMHISGPGAPLIFTSKAVPEQMVMIMPCKR